VQQEHETAVAEMLPAHKLYIRWGGYCQLAPGWSCGPTASQQAECLRCRAGGSP